MQRAKAHYLPREMAFLGAVEFTLCFALIDTMIQVVGVSVALPSIVEILPRADIALAAVLTLIIGGVALAIGLYRPEVCLNSKPALIATLVFAIGVLIALLSVGSRPTVSIAGAGSIYIAEALATWVTAVTLVRLLHLYAFGRHTTTRRILLLGEPRQVDGFSARLRSGHGRRFDPIVLPGLAPSWRMLNRDSIWGVVVASKPEGQTAEALLDCKLRGVRVLSSAAFQEKYLHRIDLDTLTANDFLAGHGFAVSNVSDALKRVSDIVIGTCMLIALLPLMVATALAVKIDSPGPVFYRQRRVGHFDKTFTLLKFRSMTADAEPSGNPLWAQKEDPRVTRVGRFIRATRIDELPQLVNVIRGEMSLVGPRPERPHFVEQLIRAIPFYRQRTYVKPGLTGWAQVNFPYGASVEDAREKLAYDLYYVKNRTILLDVFILIATIRVVLFRDGAR